MSWSMSHRTAARMLACSASSRSDHSRPSVRWGSASAASAAKQSACTAPVAALSPAISSCSRPNSRIVSSMPNRTSASSSSRRTRLWSTSAAVPSRRSSSSGAGGRDHAAWPRRSASRQRRSTDGGRVRARARPAGCSSSRSHLAVSVAGPFGRRRSTGGCPGSSTAVSSSAGTGRSLMRDAASSMASGSPSRRAQISTIEPRVVGRQLEIGPYRACPLHEERDRIGA